MFNSLCWVVKENVEGGRVSKAPMVRKFFCRVSVVRAVSALMLAGIVPDKEFTSRYMISRSSIFPILAGITPVILFS